MGLGTTTTTAATATAATTPSTKNSRYILAVVLVCIIALFQLLSEATSFQNLAGTKDEKDSEYLLKYKNAEEELSKLKGQLEESKEKLEQLQQDEERDDSVSKLQNKLKTANEEVSNLQSLLDSSKEELEQLKHSDSSIGTTNTSANNFDPNHICSVLSPSSSATRLWREHLPELYAGSILPEMAKFEHEGDHAKLRSIMEEILTPSRMRRSVQHLPTFSHHIVQHVMQKLQRRLLDPENHPPLRVAVFGGSVTLGRGCTPKRMQHVDCAWPHRLEHILNHVFGQKLIEVHNLAIGGTNSNTATNRVRFWLYNPALSKEGPDVIINSYSTNDSLAPGGKEWPKDDVITIVRNRIRSLIQPFVREALESKPCGIPPLVVHVDDYLGPQQPALLGELGYVSEMTQLAKHYDTVGISYAQVVRDIAYMNHSETDFHNAKDVHFGPFAHATIALSVAFASLELFINYCDDEYNNNNNNATGLDSLPQPMSKEEMKRGKYFLPPPLTDKLIQANSTIEYEAALDASYRQYVENGCETYDSNSNATVVDRNPCMVSWISTPGLFNSGAINNFMKAHQTQNDGWQAERANAEGWSNKDGWIATKADASFVLEFVAEKKVKTVTIYFLRSWGEKWKDSKAKFTVSRVLPDTNNTKVVAQHDIDGVFDDENYHYSLTLSETIRLEETVEVGEKITLRVDLVSGGHFKIMGMALCNKST